MQLKITDAEKEGEEDPLPRIQKKMTSQTKCVIRPKSADLRGITKKKMHLHATQQNNTRQYDRIIY